MGGNQRTYSQEFDLYRLLESILGKLNNKLDSSETIESFTTNFTEACVTRPYNLTNGCHLTTAVQSWRQKSRNKIRTNQTRFGIVSEKLSTMSTEGVCSAWLIGDCVNVIYIIVKCFANRGKAVQVKIASGAR